MVHAVAATCAPSVQAVLLADGNTAYAGCLQVILFLSVTLLALTLKFGGEMGVTRVTLSFGVVSVTQKHNNLVQQLQQKMLKSALMLCML